MGMSPETLIASRTFQRLVTDARRLLKCYPDLSPQQLTTTLHRILCVQRVRPLTDTQVRRLTLWQNGMEPKEIAEHEGVDRASVYATLAYCGIDEFARYLKHGERRYLYAVTNPHDTHCNAGSLPGQIIKLLRQHPDGLPPREIRECLQCSKAQCAPALSRLKYRGLITCDTAHVYRYQPTIEQENPGE